MPLTCIHCDAIMPSGTAICRACGRTVPRPVVVPKQAGVDVFGVVGDTAMAVWRAIAKACGSLWWLISAKITGRSLPGKTAGVAMRRSSSAAAYESSQREDIASGPGNVPAMLSYLILPALVFFFLDPYRRDRLVRFHAVQSLLFPLAAALMMSLTLALITLSAFVGWLVMIVVLDACVVLLVVLAVKAYRGEMFKLPVIGDFAEQVSLG